MPKRAYLRPLCSQGLTDSRAGEGANVEHRYDIFEVLSAGILALAMELSEARKRMADLPVPAIGGQYLIRDFCSGAVVDYTVSLRPATH